MATLEREFYRNARGRAPTDQDTWRLVFDPSTMRLIVRHEWNSMRHSGVDEFEVGEFLAQRSTASHALTELLFGRVTVDA
jgi:hypothetical protein